MDVATWLQGLGLERHEAAFRDNLVDMDVVRELTENDLIQSKWPTAPLDAIHECYIHNSDEAAK